MKKALKEIKMIAKLNVEELNVVIKITAKNVEEFDNILDQLDAEIKELPIRWSRLENYADIDKNKKITFIF